MNSVGLCAPNLIGAWYHLRTFKLNLSWHELQTATPWGWFVERYALLVLCHIRNGFVITFPSFQICLRKKYRGAKASLKGDKTETSIAKILIAELKQSLTEDGARLFLACTSTASAAVVFKKAGFSWIDGPYAACPPVNRLITFAWSPHMELAQYLKAQEKTLLASLPFPRMLELLTF